MSESTAELADKACEGMHRRAWENFKAYDWSLTIRPYKEANACLLSLANAQRPL